MGAVTGSDQYFTDIDSGFTATKWETLIQQAISRINGAARDNILPDMSGAAGSKTVSLTSGQEGYVRSIAALMYNVEYKLPGSGGVGQLSETVLDLTRQLNSLVKEAAMNLREMEVSYG